MHPPLDGNEAGTFDVFPGRNDRRINGLVFARILGAVFITGEILSAGIEEGVHRIVENERFIQKRAKLLRVIEQEAAIVTSKEEPKGLLRRWNGAARPRQSRKGPQPCDLSAERTNQRLSQADDAPTQIKAFSESLKRGAQIGVGDDPER